MPSVYLYRQWYVGLLRSAEGPTPINYSDSEEWFCSAPVFSLTHPSHREAAP